MVAMAIMHLIARLIDAYIPLGDINVSHSNNELRGHLKSLMIISTEISINLDLNTPAIPLSKKTLKIIDLRNILLLFLFKSYENH